MAVAAKSQNDLGLETGAVKETWEIEEDQKSAKNCWTLETGICSSRADLFLMYLRWIRNDCTYHAKWNRFQAFSCKIIFVCVQQLIAVKIEIPSMNVKLKLIYEKASIAVNSKAHGYVKPELSKVLDMTVRLMHHQGPVISFWQGRGVEDFGRDHIFSGDRGRIGQRR